MDRALDGDHAALSRLLECCDRQVRSSLRIHRKLAAVVDADDIMQVTYIEVFLRFPQWQPESLSAFVNWVKRIARQNLLDAIRSENRKKRPPANRCLNASQDDSYTALYESLVPATTTPSRVAARREMKRHLEEALGRLPPDYATAVRLHDLEGCSIREVARRMGRSEGAIRMLRARARDRLRELLGSSSRFFSEGD